MYRTIGKRCLDVILSSLGLLLLWPLFLIIAAAIKADDPGPVFFRQPRMGYHKRAFVILKFRTMKRNAPHNVPTNLLDQPDMYITRVGRILRKTSLDELPQLLQIWTGKMSFIGPRPVILNETELIALRDRCGAYEVRPGLSGWAQVNGRDELSAPAKAWYDGEYVRKMSFFFDMRCFFATGLKVLRCENVVEGASQEKMEHPDQSQAHELAG